MKQWFVRLSCLGDCVGIVAFKHKDVEDASVYLYILSNHIHEYQRSWRGRLKLAWRALRGDTPSDVGLDTKWDIAEFRKTMDEVYAWVESEDDE